MPEIRETQEPYPRVDQLICIATEQEITNVVPIAACQPQRVQVLVSDYARARGWPDRLRLALAQLSPVITVEEISLQSDLETQPDGIARLLSERLQSYSNQKVALAWGGGLKVQSLGMWLAFERWDHKANTKVIALLVAPASGKLLCWSRADKKPQELMIPTIPLIVRLASYGIVPTANNRATPLSATGKDARDDTAFPLWVEQAYTLFHERPEYRRLCFEHAALAQTRGSALFDGLDIVQLNTHLKNFWKVGLPVSELERAVKTLMERFGQESGNPNIWKPALAQHLGSFRKELSETMLQNILLKFDRTIHLPKNPKLLAFLKAANPENPALRVDQGQTLYLAPGITNFSRLFEWLVAYRAWLWMQKNPEKISEACMNMEVRQIKGGKVFAELDLLILSRSGRLLSIDAKSFTVSGEKQRAQMGAFSQLAGVISTFRFCFPMYQADTGKPRYGVPPSKWGGTQWYPAALRNLVASFYRDLAEDKSDRIELVPFDESDDFEQLLEKTLT